MNSIYALLVFAAVIVMIYLAASWNTSDADHYMGFDNLRPPRKRKAPNGDKENAKKE
jgi:hypothetical protein